jgi:hypothetical protein
VTGTGCTFTPSELEVTGVRFSDDSVLAWDGLPPAPPREFHVVRGLVAHLPVGSAAAPEECVGETASSTLQVPQAPPTGTAYWYLVRVRYDGACDGGYGFEGLHGARGNPRRTDACP